MAPALKTHYDNLQVSRHANSKEIKASYKRLVQKWHPDRHTENREEAERILSILNKAYAVLSDENLRQQHDHWIDTQSESSVTPGNRDNRDHSSGSRPRASRKRRSTPPLIRRGFDRWLLLIPALLILLPWLGWKHISNTQIVSAIAPGGTSSVGASAVVSRKSLFSIQLGEFFSETAETLIGITSADDAIVAFPALEKSEQALDELTAILSRASSSEIVVARDAVQSGINKLQPIVHRLQSDPGIWGVLWPALNPILLKLQRLAG